MKELIKVNEKLFIEQIKDNKQTVVNVVNNGLKTQLVNLKTDEYYWSECFFDNNYIIIYSKKIMIGKMNINIEAAYDIKSNINIDLSNERNKILIENMYLKEKNFTIAHVLTLINEENLNIIEDNEKEYFQKYLSSNNDLISREQIIEYILKAYPVFKKYQNLTVPLSALKYNQIISELNDYYWSFYSMPQHFSDLPNDEETTNKLIKKPK